MGQQTGEERLQWCMDAATREAIDAICVKTNNPEMLNALHACRPGHPLNNNPWRWRNAYALALQRPRTEIDHAALDWLAKRAATEATEEQAES